MIRRLRMNLYALDQVTNGNFKRLIGSIMSKYGLSDENVLQF